MPDYFSRSIALAATAALLAARPAPAQADSAWRAWNQPVEPFRIAGNVYYVGASDVASYLVTGAAGHVLVDAGFAETAPQILANVRRLGFRAEDVKVLLVGHAHNDHAGGLAALARATGARLHASPADAALLESGGADDFHLTAPEFRFAPVRVAARVRDGERVTVGDVTLTAHLTPGHTKGCTTWTTTATENGRPLRVAFLCSLTVPGYRLVGNARYPAIAEDYARTFRAVGALPCDVPLMEHGSQFGLAAKMARRAAGGAGAPNPFVAPAECRAIVERARRAFERELATQRAGARGTRGADASADSLAARVRALAAWAGGTAGVVVRHLESGRQVEANAAEAFPMASVFKLPLAATVLWRAERGAMRLDDSVRVRPSDLRLWHSPLAERLPGGGTLTVRDLLRAMLVEGDNSAADGLLRLVGGPGAVTARLRALGIDGVRVDRSEAELGFDFVGVASPPPPSTWTLAALQRAVDAVPLDARRAAARRFLDDPRDTATPAGLARLLELIVRGRALGPASTRLLLDLLTRTSTGPARLPALLPPGTPLAHRTGTGGELEGLATAVNDAGVITLPGGAGHAVVVVLVKGTTRPPAEVERVIAEIGRAAYDALAR
jgi:metallo-beta-lactamase class B